MNILTRGTFFPDVNQYIDNIIIGPAPGLAAQGPSKNTVTGVPWTKLENRVSLPPGPDLNVARNDPVLSELLSGSFLTVVSRTQWQNGTVTAQPFDLNTLERHEIFFRVQPLDANNLFLIPDDRLEAPSLMLPVLAVPWRVGVLKLALAGDGLTWSTVVAGACSGVTGDCAPGPPTGCCAWRRGQDGAGAGWVCCC